MKKQIKKNIEQRYFFQKKEKNLIAYKAVSHNLKITSKIRWKIQIKNLNKLHKNSSLTRIKNKCILTGRSRSIYRFFKISRIQLRKLASQGFLPGVAKYSW